jgi:hypothetical protein
MGRHKKGLYVLLQQLRSCPFIYIKDGRVCVRVCVVSAPLFVPSGFGCVERKQGDPGLVRPSWRRKETKKKKEDVFVDSKRIKREKKTTPFFYTKEQHTAAHALRRDRARASHPNRPVPGIKIILSRPSEKTEKKNRYLPPPKGKQKKKKRKKKQLLLLLFKILPDFPDDIQIDSFLLLLFLPSNGLEYKK